MVLNSRANQRAMPKKHATPLLVSALAGETHTVPGDPTVNAARDRPSPREREGRRKPSQSANAMEKLGHGVGAGECAAIGQDELHGGHARFVGEVRKPEASGCRPARQDLELAAGHRQAHEPERAGPAHGALAVVDQDGRGFLIARLDRPGPSFTMARGPHYEPHRLSVR